MPTSSKSEQDESVLAKRFRDQGIWIGIAGIAAFAALLTWKGQFLPEWLWQLLAFAAFVAFFFVGRFADAYEQLRLKGLCSNRGHLIPLDSFYCKRCGYMPSKEAPAEHPLVPMQLSEKATEMTPTLRILDDLSYVFECVAQDHMGECRYFMGILCDRVEQTPDYAIADKKQARPRSGSA